MANVDLHGIEVRTIETPRPPLAVGGPSTVGLVGAAPGSGAGAAASLTLGAGNAAFTVTADAVGVDGNDISIAVSIEAAAAIRVVNENEIEVDVVANTTAAALVAAINMDAGASALVTAAVASGSTGAAAAAAAAKTSLAGGVDPPVPLDTPVLLTAALIEALGDEGSLPAAIRDVYRTAGSAGAVIVAVRTADDLPATLAGTRAARTGAYALLDAESRTGQRPRLLAAPGARAAAVTSALQAVATELRALGVVTVDAADAAAAVAANPELSHIAAVWPRLVVSEDGAESTRAADGLVIGHIARTDREASFAASPSNRLMLGVLRTAKPVDWQIDSRTSTANVLNVGHLMTAVRRGTGVYLWGNRLSDGGFITTRRANDLVNDRVAEATLDYLDRRVDLPFVEHIVGALNGYLRGLTVDGHIRGGRAWFDPAYNTEDTLAAGQVTFSYEITLHEIAEHIVFRASVGNLPNEVLAGVGGEQGA